LTRLIDCENELLPKLFATDCITWRQKVSVEEAAASNRNKTLLEIITLKSIANFNKFLDCLSCTGQQHVVNLLFGRAGRMFIYVTVTRRRGKVICSLYVY
jgi:hypothetical protein